MKLEQKLDYMILCLQAAKEEIEYAKYYKSEEDKANKEHKSVYVWGSPLYQKRMPNGTIIRENLKMVGRMANITAKDVKLSPYHRDIE